MLGSAKSSITEHDQRHLEYHGKRKLEELQVDIPRCQQHSLIHRPKQAEGTDTRGEIQQIRRPDKDYEPIACDPWVEARKRPGQASPRNLTVNYFTEGPKGELNK